MKQRGRSSISAQSTIAAPGCYRVEPPADMPETQAAIWRQVAATKPTSWLPADSLPILAQFCRHIVTCDQLAKMIENCDTANFDQFKELLTLRDRESKIIIRLATALRFTPHSRLKAETAATQHNNAGGADKPWATPLAI